MPSLLHLLELRLSAGESVVALLKRGIREKLGLSFGAEKKLWFRLTRGKGLWNVCDVSSVDTGA